MHSKRILALDYGEKRVGLALSDPLGLFAQSLPFLENKSREQLISELKKLIGEKSVEVVVVGLPLRTDDTSGPEAEKVMEFAMQLEQECQIKVEFFDERYTTREAEEILIEEFDLSREKRKKRKDSMAACILLERYLQKKR